MSINNRNKNKVIKEKTKKEPIYIMSFEFEKGNPEKIEIYSDSNPESLANYFCKKHNLDYNGVCYLKQKIISLIQQNKNKNISNIQNKENINNNNINTSTSNNKNCTKSKQKISRNINKTNYIDNKTDNINNSRIKKKINKIENIYKTNINNNINNTQNIKKINNNIKKIIKYNTLKKYKTLKNSEFIKISKEKENTMDIKTKKNKTYQKIFISKSYKNISKENNICSKISKYYSTKFSFHPNINTNYKTDLTFEQRQTFFNNIYKKRKSELNKFYLNKKKDENGHLLFKPNLIRTRNYNNENIKINNCYGNIFEKNYLAYRKYDLKKEKLIQKYYNNLAENNKENSIKKINNKIFSRNKTRAFNNLFKILDSDEDGIITGLNININNIQKNILKILQPLLFELKEENQSLNKNEFIIAMNKLFEDISLIEKREIINKYKTIKRENKSLDIGHLTKFNLFMNNNTNKLAKNHYNKIIKCFGSLSTKQRNKEKNFEINFNKSSNINNISKYTFDNYIKNLN